MKIDLDKKIVVYDGGGPMAVKNLGFDQSVVKEKWYRWSGVYFYDECQRRGIQLITSDIYFDFPNKPEKAIFMRDTTINTRMNDLIRAGVRAAVVLVAEYPLYAPHIYFHLKRITEKFDYSFLPLGAKTLVSPKTKFRRWFAPHTYPSTTRAESNFARKKFLVLMNSNHRVRRLKRWYVSVMNFLNPLPTFVNRELYLDRLEAIKHFSRSSEFDLYGHYWDKPVRYTRGKYDKYIKKAYRGAVDDKFRTLQNYKFSICFENAIFGGWVTEKIVDSLFAGCVPVYWGAPDIAEFIPANCFIDFRQFDCDYAKLEKYLRAMDEKTYERYIDNINKFIVSPYAYNLSQEKYVNDLIEIFESYF